MRIALAIVVSICAGLACGGEGADGLDEVLVTGTRLRELREEAIKAEDRLLARYNELNSIDDLDVECIKLTPTGTRMSHRYCMLKLQRRAQEQDATAFLTFMRAVDVPNAQAPPLRETGVRLMERSEDYRRNLAKLLEDNPDLRELVSQSAAAMRRYEAAGRKKRDPEHRR